MTDTQADPLLPIDIDGSASFGPAFQIPVGDFEDPDVQDPEDEKQQQLLDDLNDRSRDDFVGLIHLGHLEDECVVAGHRFVIRTPSQDDQLQMGFVHKPYLGTVATEPAWRLVFVAAYLRRIDSVPAPDPLSASDSGVRSRFEWVKNSISSSVVIGLLYEECLNLAARERTVVEYLDRLGGA